ncbi:MAG: vitamin B12-dependent ribonucleotide reductase [Planctomycetes bacterium]|nr:vitamin B12-dependent ribonucleotide reductase [Planctomycetota bacterium]
MAQTITNSEINAKRNDGTEKLQLTPNAVKVLQKRYLRKDKDGRIDETVEELFSRVAKNIALAEKKFNKHADVQYWEKAFYEVITSLEFMPNSPTLMNAGRELQQLSACFVLPIGDSIDSIFEIIKNAALIHKSGGGTGFAFSNIRPKNDIVSTSHGMSSGPISFMKVFNEATEAINQGGFRRGANMSILRVDHPDIMEFITVKSDQTQLNNFNLSVGITEDFMNKVERDEDFDLVNPRSKKVVQKLKAKEVFDKIVDEAWKSGEPGIVFLDRLNADNPTPKIGKIESTNPCGEQPLLPYESCNLGSINLAKMVTADGEINYARLEKVVDLAVRFLDNVIEMNNYPLVEIERMTKSNRKIGMGVMGFADMLISMGIPYNSEKAIKTANEVMGFINQKSKQMSMKLAVERGAFPNFHDSIYADKGDSPIRNATTTTIAPTGTISIIAGASSGIEPLYAVAYIRNVLDGEELVEVHPMFEKIARERGFYSNELMKEIAHHGTVQDIKEIPEDVKSVFITAHDITPTDHVMMQSEFQKHTDNAVSKTVNFKNTASREDIAKVYFLSFKSGCKGVTVYRDGCRQNQVLTTGKRKEAEKAASAGTSAMETDTSIITQQHLMPAPKPRPDLTQGVTRKMRTGCGNIYVTLNYDENNKPFEVFSIMGKAGGCAASQSEAIARLISFALRSGAELTEVVKQLKGISCHSIAWGKSGKILSCADAIAKALEMSVQNVPANIAAQTLAAAAPVQTPVKEKQAVVSAVKSKKNHDADTLKKGACPDCGGILEHENGCVTCKGCGYSECG